MYFVLVLCGMQLPVQQIDFAKFCESPTMAGAFYAQERAPAHWDVIEAGTAV
jgi:hypothetical protein